VNPFAKLLESKNMVRKTSIE
jgi:hypothetical protein